MDEFPDRRGALLVAGLLVGGTILVGMVFMGGQVSTILSTVGSSVTDHSGGGSADITDGGSDTTGGASTGGGTSGQVADAAAIVPTLLIVRTGELTIQVPDLAAALRDGDAAVLHGGGYISGSSRTADGGRDLAQVEYRIPSAAWEPTLDALHALASTVVSEQIKTEDVTGQVVDLTARIANLRATEAALQAIMAKATRISDVLDVQEQLTTTRGEIETLVADKEHLQDRAAYGSLAVTYRLPVAPAPAATPIPAKGWNPGDDVARASGKLVRIGQSTTSIGIWLAIVGLPLAIGGLVLLFVGWQLYRLTRWLLGRREAAINQGA
jgi:Domain of unknown function (DUF4349)